MREMTKDRTGQNDFEIKVFSVKNMEYPMISENLFKFVFLFHGEMQVAILDKSFELATGEGVALLPGQVHSFVSYGQTEVKVLTFSPSFVPEVLESLKEKEAILPVFKTGAGLDFVEMLEIEESHFATKAYIYLILAQYIEKMSFVKTSRVQNQFIEKVTEFFSENFDVEITMESLSRHLGYDYNYTSSLFNQNFKCGFSYLLNDYRVKKAENLLLETNLSITEIAFKVGFNSLRSFNRNFLEFGKMSPRDFRRHGEKKVKTIDF